MKQKKSLEITCWLIFLILHGISPHLSFCLSIVCTLLGFFCVTGISTGFHSLSPISGERWMDLRLLQSVMLSRVSGGGEELNSDSPCFIVLRQLGDEGSVNSYTCGQYHSLGQSIASSQIIALFIFYPSLEIVSKYSIL